MQKTISPIDNQVYIEREYHSDKIEETLNNSVKAQTGWAIDEATAKNLLSQARLKKALEKEVT